MTTICADPGMCTIADDLSTCCGTTCATLISCGADHIPKLDAATIGCASTAGCTFIDDHDTCCHPKVVDVTDFAGLAGNIRSNVRLNVMNDIACFSTISIARGWTDLEISSTVSPRPKLKAAQGQDVQLFAITAGSRVGFNGVDLEDGKTTGDGGCIEASGAGTTVDIANSAFKNCQVSDGFELRVKRLIPHPVLGWHVHSLSPSSPPFPPPAGRRKRRRPIPGRWRNGVARLRLGDDGEQ